MRAPCVRFSISSLMIIVAICAGLMALVVQGPYVAMLIGPIVASALEVRRGGKGLTAGMLWGAITWMGLGLLFLVWEWYTHPASRLAKEGSVRLVIVFAAWGMEGALIGLLVGLAFYFAEYLVTRPNRTRRRAEQSVGADCDSSTMTSHDDWDSLAC
jgi:Na+/proline symporter